jgi:hypothetical protein
MSDGTNDDRNEVTRTHSIGFFSRVPFLIWAAFDALLPFLSLNVYAGGLLPICNTPLTGAFDIATLT